MSAADKIPEAELRAMVEDGLSVSQIAARTGVPRQSLHDRVKARRLRVINGRAPFASDEDILRMIADGAGFDVIREATGYADKSLRDRLVGLGISASLLKSRRGVAAARARLGQSEVPAVPKVPRLSPTPFWTTDRDAAVWGAGASWAAQADLAKRWGVPTSRITGRWHLLRAAAPKPLRVAR